MSVKAVQAQSSPESDVGDKEPGSHFPPPGEGTKQLETLDESRLTKDADGLITQIDGKPVSSYLISLTETRAKQYRRACADKKNPLSKNALGDCIAVGVDRRTGRVYEGINGRRGSQMDPEDVHPTIRIRVDRVEQAGPYPDDNGEPNFAFPHPDIPLRHAEVKATNQAEDGPSIEWFPDGVKLSEGTVRKGFPIGPWRLWHANGVLAEEKVFDDAGKGHVLRIRRWSKSGDVVKDTAYEQS